MAAVGPPPAASRPGHLRGPSTFALHPYRGANSAAAAAAWRYAAAVAWRRGSPVATPNICATDSSAASSSAGAPSPNSSQSRRASSGAASSLTATARHSQADGQLPVSAEDAKVLVELEAATTGLVELRQQWEALPATGSSVFVSQLLQRDAELRAALQACPFGDPAQTTTVTRHRCSDSVVSTHCAATQAYIEAELARLLWEVRSAEQFGSAAQGGFDTKSLAIAHINISVLRLRLFDIDGAYKDLQRAWLLDSSDQRLALLSRYCAQLKAPRDTNFLNADFSAGSHNEALLQKMRKVFLGAGYQIVNVLKATKASSMSEFIFVDSRAELLERNLLESAEEPNPMTREERTDPPLSPNLVDLIRLFLLHRVLPLSRFCLLFGPEILEMLLVAQVVRALEGSECRLVSPAEAVAAVRSDMDGCGALFAFSTVAIWPLEEDLLITTDYEQTFSSEDLEPVMYLSEDSLALLSATPRERAPRILDVCCGSGVQGIVALRHYADEAIFADLNPRALRFTRFNLALNGLAQKALGFHLSSVYNSLPANIGQFDAIVANPPFVPNPQGIASGAGAMFGNGGDTGEQVVAELVSGADRLLLPGGRLSIVSMAPNVEGMPARIEGWYSFDAGSEATCEALVFRGAPTPAERYLPTASEVETQRYRAALKSLGITTLSEVILVLTKSCTGAMTGPRASLAGEPRENLWGDTTFLRLVVQRAAPSLQTDTVLPVHAAARAAVQFGNDAQGVATWPPPSPPRRTPATASKSQASRSAAAAAAEPARDALPPTPPSPPPPLRRAPAVSTTMSSAAPPTPPPPPRRAPVKPAGEAAPRHVSPAASPGPSALPRKPHDHVPAREGRLPGFQPGFFPAHCQEATPEWEAVARELSQLAAAGVSAR